MNLVRVTNPEAIGMVVRSTRKAQSVRQADLAQVVGASHVLLRDIEYGKPTVNIGKVLEVLEELGIHIYLDVPKP